MECSSALVVYGFIGYLWLKNNRDMVHRIQILGIVLLAAAVAGFHAGGQNRLEGWNAAMIDGRLQEGRWPAHWISVQDMSENEYAVCHFRKTFDLEHVPESFIVHVSADNRYKLYVNGRFVGLGPEYGDVYNWNYTTYDLKPYLKQGENTVAAVVWNFAASRPLAQMSFGKTGFIMQGNTPEEDIVNTDGSWLGFHDRSYSPYMQPVSGYYAAGACEQFTASGYPWGWESPDYDDSAWPAARTLIQGAAKGAKDYPGWQLVPSPVRQMELKPFRMPEIIRGTGRICDRESMADVEVSSTGFLAGTQPLVIPPDTEAELLIDNSVLVTGYPTIEFSGGTGAEMQLQYAESLYKEGSWNDKGDRNEVDGKHFIGYADRILPDGGPDRAFTPLWWRTWRYVLLKIRTADEPLVIDDLYAVSSMYPLERESSFSAPGIEDAGRMIEIGWRTARLCAADTYMDCPYYEQLQYFGDTRIQAMITLFNTRNDEMVRYAIEQGFRSMVPDGITMSRYPSSLHQFIPPFSLWWICMCHDYWMYRGDSAFLKTMLPATRSILSWYETFLRPDMSLDRIPFWFFMDWCGTPDGEPVREKDGNSIVQDLQYVLALSAAADMEAAFGQKALAEHYSEIADAIRKTVKDKYWDDAKGLFADTFNRDSYSQHGNILAILAGVVSGEDAGALFDRLLADSSIWQCTLYYRYYLMQAMRLAGRGDDLQDELQPWRDQLALGLTTWAEKPEPSRSDCHAWSSSLNVEFFRTLLGIESAAPGFSEVRIAPALGSLKEASGEIPHPDGKVSVSYSVSDDGRLTAEISIPEAVAGTFVWKGRTYRLKGGANTVTAR